MMKNIKYFCILLVVCAYQQKLHTMEATQEWIGTSLANILPLQPEYIDDPIDAPEKSSPEIASPGYLTMTRDVTKSLAELAVNIPDATKSIIDLKNNMSSKSDETPSPFSYAQLEAQKKAEHKRSQDRLRFMATFVADTGLTIDKFTRMLIVGSQFTQNIVPLMQTFQPNPDDKGKEEAVCPRQKLIAIEKQRTADRRHFKFLGGQVIGVIESSNAALQQMTSLAIQTNRNLETIERIYTLINQSNNNRFQPRSLEDMRVLHQQRIAEGQQFQTTLTWTSYYAANFMRSLENLFTSDSYRHNITHTKNNAVKTFGSITAMSVGGLLLYKHLANHVDQKSTILASVGAGLIAVPWMASYIDR